MRLYMIINRYRWIEFREVEKADNFYKKKVSFGKQESLKSKSFHS